MATYLVCIYSLVCDFFLSVSTALTMFLNMLSFGVIVSLLLGCVSGTKELEFPHNKHIRNFNEIGFKQPIVTDKIKDSHNYGIMYGMFLGPIQGALKHSNGAKLKLLEIGLGCHMKYGAGASVILWKSLFGEGMDLWEAEFNAACVEESRKNGHLKGFTVLVGKTALQRRYAVHFVV